MAEKLRTMRMVNKAEDAELKKRAADNTKGVTFYIETHPGEEYTTTNAHKIILGENDFGIKFTFTDGFAYNRFLAEVDRLKTEEQKAKGIQ
jgi:hypothetical protein